MYTVLRKNMAVYTVLYIITEPPTSIFQRGMLIIWFVVTKISRPEQEIMPCKSVLFH